MSVFYKPENKIMFNLDNNWSTLRDIYKLEKRLKTSIFYQNKEQRRE